jgi:hypothetical protein
MNFKVLNIKAHWAINGSCIAIKHFAGRTGAGCNSNGLVSQHEQASLFDRKAATAWHSSASTSRPRCRLQRS